MKKKTLLLAILLVALLITTSSSPRTDASASTVNTSVWAGGAYTLTIDSPAGQQFTGYQFFPTGTTAYPSTCGCCNSYLPCTRK